MTKKSRQSTDYSQDDSINNTSSLHDAINTPSAAWVLEGQYVLSVEHQEYLRRKYGDDYMKRLRMDTHQTDFKPGRMVPALIYPNSLPIIIHGKEIVLSTEEAHTLLYKWNEKNMLDTMSSGHHRQKF